MTTQTTTDAGATGLDPEAEVVAQAAVRAAAILDIAPTVLAKILGLFQAGADRLRGGRFDLAPDGEPFDRAALFLRLFSVLDAMTGGDEQAARSWLRTYNTTLRGVPLALAQTRRGLSRVVQYLEASLAR